MKKKWQFYSTDKEKVRMISEKYNINKLLATILVNRDIIDEEKINVFLNPTRNNFHNPLDMPDMPIAIERLLKAIKTQEKTIIYGDYDVDGITSTTVLKKFLEERGLHVDSYIPNRLNEGYGLNKNAIDTIAKQGYNLMITVDCGITASEEIDYANSLGIDTIITDHHEPSEKIPNAIAVVDAKRKDNKYPCRDLAGVGVVFKLIQALGQKLELDEKEYLKYLDIICVGTISDIVPLVDENRVIAKLGLKLVEQTRNIGLKSLLIASGYKNVDSTTISFGVAPRINASGRMGYQEDALDLFLSNDIKEATTLTQKLNEYNTTRQEIEKEIYNEALKKIEKENLAENSVIVVAGNNWHHGVIGIVASKISELYFKPCILLSFDDDIGKGSGRSIPGFDLHDALVYCSDTLDKFGGHAMAVGVTVTRDKLEDFRSKFEEYAEQKNIKDIVPIINIDAEFSLNEVKKEYVESLKMLEPFGEGNKMPLFAFKNLKIDSIRSLSEGKHIKLTLQDNNNMINAIGFNMGELADEYRIGDKVDVVGVLEINTFNGVQNIQINIKDIMKSL
ncbi:MAG: single-stranded-DNA-specific exonuclease RecJ [Clostridia bacterium]|nr:single-stranded-DNA-specific exonuclease RecJ [Clostridia bacterium]